MKLDKISWGITELWGLQHLKIRLRRKKQQIRQDEGRNVYSVVCYQLRQKYFKQAEARDTICIRTGVCHSAMRCSLCLNWRGAGWSPGRRVNSSILLRTWARMGQERIHWFASWSSDRWVGRERSQIREDWRMNVRWEVEKVSLDIFLRKLLNGEQRNGQWLEGRRC